jgi:hypothetical protein
MNNIHDRQALVASADSSLLLAIREAITMFVRQKGTTGIDLVLALVPPRMQQMMIEVIDKMAAEGVISVDGKLGSVHVNWHGVRKEAA